MRGLEGVVDVRAGFFGDGRSGRAVVGRSGRAGAGTPIGPGPERCMDNFSILLKNRTGRGAL